MFRRIPAPAFLFTLSALLLFFTGPVRADFPGSMIRVAVDAEEGYLLAEGIAADVERTLKQTLPEVPVELRFVTKDEMRRAVATRSVELVLTTPFSYRRLGLTDARVIAGLIQARSPDPNRAGGAVVLVDADREDLSGFSSLAGKRVALSSHYGLNFEGIFRAAWLDEGNAPKTLRIADVTAKDDEALAGLERGDYDALVLPACRLERLSERRTLATENLRVVAPKSSTDLACAHSTALYPGPVLVATPTLSPAFSRRIIGTLLSAPPTPAGFFWGEATDFAAVDRALTMLELDAYADLRRWSLSRILRDYAPWFAGAAFMLVLLVSHSFLVAWLVRRRTRELTASLARERLFEAQAETAGKRVRMLERIGLLGQVGSLFAHEVRQPLSAIAVYAYGLKRMIERGTGSEQKLAEGLEKISEQTANAEAIVAKIRSYLKRDADRKENVPAADVVEKAVKTFEASGRRRSAIRLSANRPKDRPGDAFPVRVDAMEVELVLLNLFRNAEEIQTAAAVKNPEITVEIGRDAKTPEDVTITVSDRGPALDDEAFAAFTARLAAMETTKKDGLGLGLSIVASLTEAQGGRVSFARSARGGLSVTLHLPAAPETPGGEAQRFSEGSAEKQESEEQES